MDYSATDVDPLDGINYYRLKQTDFNGETHFSDVIAVTSTGVNVLQITAVYPNPAENNINVNIFSQITAEAELSFIDLYGKELIKRNLLLSEGENKLQQELNELKPGYYFISIKVPKKSKQYNSKFLKMN